MQASLDVFGGGVSMTSLNSVLIFMGLISPATTPFDAVSGIPSSGAWPSSSF
jgi:hypothetical protein